MVFVEQDDKEQNKEDFSQRDFRLEKRKKLLSLGKNPYNKTIELNCTYDELKEKFNSLQDGEHSGKSAAIAGRVIFRRDTGKLSFISMQQGDGKTFQAMFSLAEIGEDSLNIFKQFVDLGDFVAIEGETIKSKRGELSILVHKWEIISKAIQPLPVLHKDLNEETRARKRYTDLIVNENARKMVRIRSNAVSAVRKTLTDNGFLEIETPMLQTIHGGAAATPFSTHINAFDMDLFLRISPELFLKKALVGGIEKVFEINRNFRNEGVDSSHSPEFTMLEAYETYGDYKTIGKLTREMIQNAVYNAYKSYNVTLADGTTQDFSGSWDEIDFYDSLSDGCKTKITPETDIQTLRKIAEKANLKRDLLKDKHLNEGKLAEILWEHFIGDSLFNPTFVYDYPSITSPLTKPSNEKGKALKWDLYIRGIEIATGYSELNDPVIQREHLTKQALMASGGDSEAMLLDEDFLNALEHGMPPAGGMGMGIDRLLIAMTGYGIRETITFPLIKPIVDN